MKPSYIRRWIWYVLPLLVARVFVPAGFMLSNGQDGLSLVLCSGTGPVATFQATSSAAAEQQHRAEHGEHHYGHGGGGGDTHDDAPCPFSLAVSACAADIAYFAAPDSVTSTQKIVSYSNPPPGAGPVQIDRIRGPPLFA